MSFILDALKKSETDRQRQTGPALFEVKVPPPRNGLPLWAVGLVSLLIVNLVIVAWVLLRRPAPTEASAPPLSPAAPPAAITSSSGLQRQTITPATQTSPAQTAAMTQPAAAAQPQQATGASVTPNSTNVASAPAQTDAGGESPNPDDYAPAADPTPSSSFGSHVTRTTASGLPLSPRSLGTPIDEG